MLIGLWLAPYLVSHIGTIAYGFVPIAAILTEYISVITNALNQAISRYLVLNIQKADWDDANRTFNTAFFSNVVVFLLQLPLLGILLFNLNSLFTIPSELKSDVMALCLLSMLAFSISVFSSVFSTSMFAYNRLDLQRMMDIIRFALRVGTIVVGFTLDTPKLLYVGIGEFLAALVLLLISTVYWRKLTPKLHISISSFDRGRLKNVLSMSGWLIINYVGYLLFIKIDLIVVNNFIGPKVTGEYAAVLQWSNVIRTVVSVLAELVSPLILAAYAKEDFERLKYILVTSMKFLGAAVAIITGIIMVQSYSLLNIWIGPEIAQIYPLMILLVVHLSVNLSVLPLFTVFTAYNRVTIPGILTLVGGVMNFGLAVFFAKFTDLGIYGVALAGLIVLTLKNGVFTPIYASRIMKLGMGTFVSPILKSVISMGMVALVAQLVRFFVIDSWAKLAISSAIIGIAVLPMIWFVIFNREDRKFIIGLVPQSIRNKVKWLD